MLDRVGLKLLAVLAYDIDSVTSSSPLDDGIVDLKVWQSALFMPVADFPFDVTYDAPIPPMSRQVSYPVLDDIASGRHGATVSPCNTTSPPIFLRSSEMAHLDNHRDIHVCFRIPLAYLIEAESVKPAIQFVQATGKKLPRKKVVAETQEKIEDDARVCLIPGSACRGLTSINFCRPSGTNCRERGWQSRMSYPLLMSLYSYLRRRRRRHVNNPCLPTVFRLLVQLSTD